MIFKNLKLSIFSVAFVFVAQSVTGQTLPNANVWGNTLLSAQTQNSDTSGYISLSQLNNALYVNINNVINVPVTNRIIYSNGTNLTSNSGLTYSGSSFGVMGTGVFTSTVSGANASSASHFTTLSQLQTAVSGTTNYVPKFTGTNAIGNSALTDISSVLTYIGESKATKFTSTGTAITGKSYLKHQITGIPSDVISDETFFIWGDRDYLKDCALWGDVTFSITGAGNIFTNSRAYLNNMFDLAGTTTLFQNLDSTSTQIVFTIDLKADQPNYGQAFVAPVIVYRWFPTATFTTYKRCKVEVSRDNVTWYTNVDNTDILSVYSTAWISDRVPMAHPSVTFRYVRFTLSDKQGTGGSCEIAMMGLRSINAPIFPSLITKAGGSIWGDLKLYNEGGITTPLITLAKTGSATATNFVSTVANGTQPYATTSTTVNTNLNADLLDGQTGSYYQSATNINAGTLADARLSSNVALKNIDNSFSVNQTVPNATAGGHALNKTTGDAAYLGITATATNSNALRGLDTNVIAQRNQLNTFTQKNVFTKAVQIADAIGDADAMSKNQVVNIAGKGSDTITLYSGRAAIQLTPYSSLMVFNNKVGTVNFNTTINLDAPADNNMHTWEIFNTQLISNGATFTINAPSGYTFSFNISSTQYVAQYDPADILPDQDIDFTDMNFSIRCTAEKKSQKCRCSIQTQ